MEWKLLSLLPESPESQGHLPPESHLLEDSPVPCPVRWGTGQARQGPQSCHPVHRQLQTASVLGSCSTERRAELRRCPLGQIGVAPAGETDPEAAVIMQAAGLVRTWPDLLEGELTPNGDLLNQSYALF